MRPDEAEKIRSLIRERGSYTIIDKVTVKLNTKVDAYQAFLANLGEGGVAIQDTVVKDFDRLLVGGIWCILNINYFFEEGQKGSPFSIVKLTPIQMATMKLEEFFTARSAFSEEQWLDVLLRSTGMEPANLKPETRWHLLARMIPLVENNYNLCELGPRGTGKSHIYKEISPNSILVSGGQTTVANLFYNMASHKVGLVGLWDCVAFDEVAGINFKDKDGVQIMKDYMASGSFSRGKEAIAANAGMVFVGNINQSVEQLVKTSHLFAPFPEVMIDTAFFDRMHAYLPGWEIPKMRPEFFTNRYGLITDYLAEFMREMRKRTFTDVIDKWFQCGKDLNQRDNIAIRKTVSGLLKLLYPAGNADKEAVERCLRYALQIRRRVKEQLKKIGGMEFYDVNFSYIDKETEEEKFVGVAEQGSGSLIPEGPGAPGTLHTISVGSSAGLLGLYRLELQITSGSGKLSISGVGTGNQSKESIKIGFDYFKANASNISSMSHAENHDYHLHVVELHNTGASSELTLVSLVSFASALLGKPVLPSLVVLGSMSLGGAIVKVDNLAARMQNAFDSGAKAILMPMANVNDIASVPGELFGRFQVSFYTEPIDAIKKALGIN